MTARDHRAGAGLVALIGVALGASAGASGLFDTALWRPVALGVFLVALMFVVATRRSPSVPALAALAGLAVVWGWAWLSVGWAESTSRAETMASRWGLHVALFTVLVLAVRDARSRLAGLAVLALPALCIAGWVLVRLLAGSGPGLFVGGQLSSPLGYSNADATFFIVAMWPALAAAESRRLAVSALAIAGVIVLGALAVLTQSRGAIVALGIAAVAIVALVPGRARRMWVVVTAALGIAALYYPFDVLTPVIDSSGVPTKGDLREAGAAIAAMAVAVAILWALANVAADRIGRRSPDGPRIRARASTAGLATLAVVAVGTLALAAGPIADRISSEYDDFVHLRAQPSGESTLLGGGPNQYDYWRIAISEFRDAPLKGVGGGNYQRDYFRERRTNEDVRQPHSLAFQTLAELGLVGILGLLVFVIAVLTGAARVVRRAGASVGDRRVAVGAGGAFVAWLIHLSIDWSWLFPTLMGMGLLAAALLLAPSAATGEDSGTRAEPPTGALAASGGPRAGRSTLARVVRIGAVAAAAVAFAAAAGAAGRQITIQHHRAQARAVLGTDPVLALKRTSEALALGDEDVGTHYIRAAAFARLDDFPDARGELALAARLEPHAWVTWALVGDMELRKGHIGHARAAYRRALALNPRDQGLRQAAADPRALARTLGAEAGAGR